MAAWQIRYPLDVGADGSFVEVEQDSLEDIESSGALLLDTRPGQLPWNRLKGTPSPLGTNDPEGAAEEIELALGRWEPRAQFRVEVADSDDRHVSFTVDLEDA